jgi:hypothetical protein
MLNTAHIESIAKEAATAHISPQLVVRVVGEAIVDAQGADALRITVVVAPSAVDSITGDDALNALVEVQRRLEQAGESRFALIDYATEAELADVGD